MRAIFGQQNVFYREEYNENANKVSRTTNYTRIAAAQEAPLVRMV
jgi:hypothetical protein